MLRLYMGERPPFEREGISPAWEIVSIVWLATVGTAHFLCWFCYPNLAALTTLEPLLCRTLVLLVSLWFVLLF